MFLLLLQALVALAIAAGLHAHFGAAGLPVGWAILFGVLPVLWVRAVIAANNFRLAASFAGSNPPPALGARDALGLYLRELAATLLSSSWNMPFRPLAGVSRCTKPRPGPAVLLIHGYGCNSGYWRTLHRHLDAAGIAHGALDLEPVLADIDTYVPQVDAAIEALRRATGRDTVILLGHSMGGLVARAWVRAHGTARLAGIITLGTPHHGTGLARFGPGENSRQMRREAVNALAGSRAGSGTETGTGTWAGTEAATRSVTVTQACNATSASTWLQALHAAQPTVAWPLVSIYSLHDNIVAPAASAIVPGATNIAFTGIGHVALASHPRVIECVLDQIRRIDAAVPGAVAPSAQPAMSIQEKPSC